MKGAADAPAGERRRYPQVALGKGSIDRVKTFRAARVGGVENYFVEQSGSSRSRASPTSKALKV